MERVLQISSMYIRLFKLFLPERVLIACIFKGICPFNLSCFYCHNFFIIFDYSPFNACKTCSYAPSLIPDIDNLFTLFPLTPIILPRLSLLLIF